MTENHMKVVMDPESFEPDAVALKKAFDTATLAGEVLLFYGAEIYRVEETIERIARALGLETLQTFVITNGLFASAEVEHQATLTKIIHISFDSIHLGKIAAVNEVSRQIERHLISQQAANDRLIAIKNDSSLHIPQMILASSIGAASFCYLLGGQASDSILSSMNGLLIGALAIYGKNFIRSKIILLLVQSLLISLVANFSVAAGFGQNIDKVIIGSIIPLIPGVHFINSIKEFADRDYLSGVIRIIDALQTILFLAIGIGLSFQLFSSIRML